MESIKNTKLKDITFFSGDEGGFKKYGTNFFPKTHPGWGWFLGVTGNEQVKDKRGIQRSLVVSRKWSKDQEYSKQYNLKRKWKNFVTIQGLAISEITIKRRQLRTDGYLTKKEGSTRNKFIDDEKFRFILDLLKRIFS